MNKTLWYQIALLNLAIVAFLGLSLRYNQVYYIPFIDQKNLLHAHSHFAFGGWIGFLLNILIIDRILNGFYINQKKWNAYLLVLLLVNYAMMISFLIQGYKALSIIFSTASIFISYYFAYVAWKGINRLKASSDIEQQQLLKHPARFIKASLLFLVISSIGPYVLAYLISIKNTHAYLNHNALYWFLHFQYNGFFSFAVLGLMIKGLQHYHLNYKYLGRFFYLLLIACIPAYMLTFLWQGVLIPVLINNIITAILLLTAIICFVIFVYNNFKSFRFRYKKITAILMIFSMLAYILKVVLQSITAFPALSHLVFGYRSIVVGYLHLIFLVFISLFLLTELIFKNILPISKPIHRIIILSFCFFVLMNELLLGLQGFSAVFNIAFPNLYPSLYYNSILLFATASAMAVIGFKKGKNPDSEETI